MSELEHLSNDELRIELQKFGFANMPVTVTTRKVLLKKLKIAMETQKSKVRRETVAVMKASDDDDVPLSEFVRGKKDKTPRRATIAAVEKTKKVPATTTTKNGADTPPKSKSPSRRSSSRATPVKDKPIVSSSAYTLHDQSDDDIIEIIEPQVLTRRSKSKTPTTLSKNERISHYVENIRNIPIVLEEDNSTEEDEDRSFEKEFQQPAPVASRRKTYNAPIHNYNTYTQRTTLYSDKQSNEDDGEEINAPYLSNFAKRLSTLRAEPLDSGLSKYKRETVNDFGYTRNIPSTSSSNVYRNTQYSKPLLNDMAYEFDKMDKKFSIRKYVYFCLLVMIIVAIYVFVFT